MLIDELLDGVAILSDHLEVTAHGAPTLNVLLSEVGLGVSQNAGVGGTRGPDSRRVALLGELDASHRVKSGPEPVGT